MAIEIDETDGLSMILPDSGLSIDSDSNSGSDTEFPATKGLWRFNLRCSKTEPLVRLNVESRGDIELMQRKTAELMALLTE